MKEAKELFINSIRQIPIRGSTVIPTVVLYKGGKPYAGIDALENCDDSSALREDFKTEIGLDDPIKLAQQQVGAGTSSRRSTLGIAKDFVDYVLGQGLSAIERQGFQRPSRILIAEPLTLAHNQVAHHEWLSNYRQSLKRIMAGKFAEIDFMPEPFAVFQYYRYGVRHALVAQRQKHVALVIDFGGGTFDTSVIETTAAGDISRGGRNSRPLAARSIPVGGFYINGKIAEMLLFKALDKGMDKPSVRKAIEAFPALKNMDDETLTLQRSDHAVFTRNFRRLLHSVERAKCTVCCGVTNWRLDANLAGAVGCPVQVPQRPMHDAAAFIPIRLEAADLRPLSRERIWKQMLLPSIRDTLKKAESELGGKPVSIVLLSGGSSNIRWLKPLIKRDLTQALPQAEILELSENFQEIVAKGLAVECARRFYNEGDGDFRAVTYNRLCLGLDPNGRGFELKKFIPESSELGGVDLDEGVLIPSATRSERRSIGRPLRWKVRPGNLPTRTLDYYFMRSSFDPNEVGSRQNLDTRVQTPAGSSLGRSVGIELVVREDGTADPSFVYGHGSQSARNTVVRGRPFFLDMTFAVDETGGDTYLGFDFGTSTSSLCYVDAADIRAYADRAKDQTWLELSALIDVLPYPAAYPLARFLSETSGDPMERWGREAFESMLTLAAYLAYAGHCTVGGGSSAFFKNFRRSAGPLWAMLKSCASASGPKWEFCEELLPLFVSPTSDEIDRAVSKVALTKHGKRGENLDYPRLLGRVGNILAKTFNGKVFGFFEEAHRKPFSMRDFEGIFRGARGSSPTFIDIYEYEGPENFPAEFVFVVDLTKNVGMPVFPLFVRGLDKDRPHFVEPDFFVYDIVRAGEKEIAFRVVQERDEVTLSAGGSFADLYRSVAGLLRSDPEVAVVRNLSLRARSSE